MILCVSGSLNFAMLPFFNNKSTILAEILFLLVYTERLSAHSHTLYSVKAVWYLLCFSLYLAQLQARSIKKYFIYHDDCAIECRRKGKMCVTLIFCFSFVTSLGEILVLLCNALCRLESRQCRRLPPHFTTIRSKQIGIS